MESVKPKRKIRRMEEEDQKAVSRRLHRMIGESGTWPLNAPGMPPPGPDFLHQAKSLGCDTVFEKKSKEITFTPGSYLKDLYARALREPGFTMSVEAKKGVRSEVVFVPGHIWGQHAKAWRQSMGDKDVEVPPVDGPHPAEVMILGKIPWHKEVQELRNLVGDSGEILTHHLRKLHIKGAAKFYITNLVKFMPPDGQTNLRAGWIADCMPLLHAELRIVRPKYILCLGADASKALLGKKFNVSYMEGRVVEHTFPIHLSEDEEPETHTSLVMTVLHPAEVSREPSKDRILERGLSRFSLLLTGARFDQEEKNLDHRMIDTLEDAQEWVEEVNALFVGRKRKDKLIAWDAEWQGQHPMNKGSYLRTVQCSWGEKKAVCFKIAHQGGKPAFRDRDGKPAFKRLVKLLNKFMTDKRAGGHFFVSDLEWLQYYGIDPIQSCRVPLADKGDKFAWERLRDGEGWLDFGMMIHAVEETAELGLKTLALRYTTAPRYDVALEDWKKEYCKEKGIKPAALEGYGDCPDKILVPYANYDADATYRGIKYAEGLLDKDYEGNCCWEPCWESMIAQAPILTIHKNGILVDRPRIDKLSAAFVTARAATEDKIKRWARWDEFNIRSVFQVREFLFGERLNGKPKVGGRSVRIRPKDAKSLYVKPLLDTSKPPRRWEDLVERGQHHDATPGTGKMILAILAQENLNVAEQINWIRDYRFLDQVLKSVLRPPKEDEEGGWYQSEDGLFDYDAGLAVCIDDDGRVRTHLYPTAETGRWKSARPNLQNISKSRDDDYVRMLGGHKNEWGQWVGGEYKHKLRSIFMATPGYGLIEFDYTGAELYGMALMSGCAQMIEHCQRALLNEDDPNYYDIHSNVAVLAFRLNCEPTKSALKKAGLTRFRTLAKNVIFGIAYGRGAKAIALQAKENQKAGDPEISVDEAQAVIDAIFEMYPELLPFFEEAKSRALTEKWLSNCYGRLRRFPSTRDFKLEGEFERQAMNFPIQSMIASAVDRGLAWLCHYIEEQGLSDDIRLLLQIHDAGLVECRYDLIPHAIKLIKHAMIDMVPIYPTDLAGVPSGDGPYHLGLDIHVENHWGEPFSLKECKKFGIPVKYAAKEAA